MIQSSTTPDAGHHMRKWQNSRIRHIQESQEASPLPAGDQKAAWKRHDSMTDKDETQITKRIHKRSTALERSVRKLLEGLNMFDGTNLSLLILMCGSRQQLLGILLGVPVVQVGWQYSSAQAWNSSSVSEGLASWNVCIVLSASKMEAWPLYFLIGKHIRTFVQTTRP